ncbi:MAG: MucR family transcriptional regulator [Janthinobacterium lividum]
MLDETMPEAADVTLIEMTTDLVAAYVTKNHVRAAELPNLISTIHASLAGMGSEPEAAPKPMTLVPAVPIKKSVTDEFIISLEDGRKFKSMKRYLSVLGMTPEQYRAKWDLPKDYPMVSPAYGRKRSDLARSIGLGSLRKAEG